MSQPSHILIVDGDRLVARSLAERLAGWGHVCVAAGGSEEALTRLRSGRDRIQVLITDLNLPGAGGLDLLRRLPAAAPGVVPVVLTGFGKIASAVEAVKLGANDYLTKPATDSDLRTAVQRAAARYALLGSAPAAGPVTAPAVNVPRGMVGSDPAMLTLYAAVTAAADTDAPIWISGEPGTGKDLVARAVHAAGRARGGGPLVVRSAAELDADLASDAGRATWAAAAGGTLLLRGLDGLPASAAATLLDRLRGVKPAEVRLIATAARASGAPLPRALVDRLSSLHLAVPPLRERPEDLEPLARHFLKRTNGRARRERTFGRPALQALFAYGWPGNVRELANAVEHAVTLSPAIAITPDDLPDAIARAAAPEPAVGAGAGAGVIPALADGWTPTPLTEALLEPERQILRAALEAHGWNRNAAARDLKIDRTTLYKKIKRFGLDRPGGSS